MEYKVGDHAYLKVGKEYRPVTVLAVLSGESKYTVSVENGHGGFHTVYASELFNRDDFDVSEIHKVEDKVPSWY